LSPCVYTVDGEECAIEPLFYPWHFSVPYMAARWDALKITQIGSLSPAAEVTH